MFNAPVAQLGEANGVGEAKVGRSNRLGRAKYNNGDTGPKGTISRMRISCI